MTAPTPRYLRSALTQFVRCCGLSLAALVAAASVRADGPTIASQPQNLSLSAGQTASFRVGATGSDPFSYSWRRDGQSIAGATSSSYVIDRVSIFDAGSYNVLVRNGAGEVLSTTAVLSVAPTQYPGVLGIDPSFSSDVEWNAVQVYAIAPQPDGKLIIGGKFIRVNGVARVNLARIDQNGVVDPTFNPGTGPDAVVYAIAVRPDGRILVGGEFTGYDGTACGGLVSLNADGSLDGRYDAGTGVDGEVRSIVLQADGRVLLGGRFNHYRSSSCANVARTDPYGAFDSGFSTGSGASGLVFDLALQPDGKVLVGGGFSQFNGRSSHGLVRLNSDGSNDTGFSPTLPAGDYYSIYLVAAAPNGKVVVSGGGTGAPRLTRLNADGSVDSTFNPGTGPNSEVYAIDFRPDGSMVIAGWFTSYNNQARSRVARIKSDGALDPSFDPPAGAIDREVQAIWVDAQGNLVIGGPFQSIGLLRNAGLGRLHSDGSVDAGFPGDLRSGGLVNATLRQTDGKYVVGGRFTQVGGESHTHLARINADGSVDSSFRPQVEFSSTASVEALALQRDGKIVVGGNFNTVNGVYRRHLARLNSDGTLDTSFEMKSALDYFVDAVFVQNDDRIVIGGAFKSVAGIDRKSLARVDAKGNLDTTFPVGIGPDDWVRGIRSLPDGRLMITGLFKTFSGVARNGIALLSADGQLDATFDSGTALASWPMSLLLAANGDVYAGGSFYLNGSTLVNVARLNSSGTLDLSYRGSGFSDAGSVGAMLLANDGKLLVAQSVTSSATPAPKGFARLLSSGAVDPTFQVTGLKDAKASRICMLDDGRLVVAGSVFSDGACLRAGMARFAPWQTPVVTGASAMSFGVGMAGSYSLNATGVPAPTLKVVGGTFPTWARLDRRTGVVTGTPVSTSGSPFQFSVRATNAAGDSVLFPVVLTVGTVPAVTTQPHGARAQPGDRVVLSVQNSGTPSAAYQWRKNGVDIAGATAASFVIEAFGDEDTGAYTVMVSNSLGSVVSDAAIVGRKSSAKVIGSGKEVGADIAHPSGRIFDQILLSGPAATITADPGQTTRVSYVDLTDDIVQVEFSGAGSLTLSLEGASGPAVPVKYQQAVEYMKGHARIVVTGADETTNLSVFSVGRANAVNQALFRSDVTYDGVADFASVAIASVDGKFGGLRMADASCFAVEGTTGIDAPGVSFTGPVFISDISASNAASPVFILGSGTQVKVTGGDLFQANGRSVRVKGIAQLVFADGTTSHGILLPAQQNKARLEEEGVDVTAKIVVNP